MKFSVAIPSHNRLELLKEAIYTIQVQNWDNWELVIFDNCSNEKIDEYIAELKDPRIRCQRSEVYLPVCDSWNRAMDMTTGDYVVFLGDDDGLAPNFFSRLSQIVKQYSSPELLYCAIYQFMHPGVAPWANKGYIANMKNVFFFKNRQEPFFLSKKQITKAVKGSIHLQRNFTFNIQAFVFSRGLLDKLKMNGEIFQSPFPDYYLANVAIAQSERTLVVPDPMCIAGVSKKSVGYALFNSQEDKFSELLNTNLSSDPFYTKIKEWLLLGSLYDVNYLIAMMHVVNKVFPLLKAKVNWRRYRRLQIYNALCLLDKQGESFRALSFWNHLTFCEKSWTFFYSQAIQWSKKHWLFAKAMQILYAKHISPHSFQPPMPIYKGKTYYSLIRLYNDLHKGILG